MVIDKPKICFSINKSRVLFLLYVVLTVEISRIVRTRHPDAGLDTIQLVQKHNYTIEEHEVITEDGYVLKLHRIPYKNEKDANQRRIPVLVLPGILQTSADYVLLGPERSLAYPLVEAGYDVWLGNPRGTNPSKSHKHLHPEYDEEEFWNFGIDDIGKHDLPAIIDYVLDVTHEKKLHYIGFSQGTTLSFILLSERPEYNEKVRSISAIAPAAYMGNSYSPYVRLAATLNPVFEMLQRILGVYQFLPTNSIAHSILKIACDEQSVFSHLCVFNHFMFTGLSYEELDMSHLSVLYTNFPAGGSMRQINQYLQYVKTGNFSKYNFGVEENLRRYGQDHPPSYTLSAIQVPVISHYGLREWSVAPQDVQKFAASLSNSPKSYAIAQESFNHIDFLYGMNSGTFNKILIRELKKH